VHAEVVLERTMHARFPAAEQDELAGTSANTAPIRTRRPDGRGRLQGPGTALRVHTHTREELGIDPQRT
jgi:hypothetical protein